MRKGNSEGEGKRGQRRGEEWKEGNNEERWMEETGGRMGGR